MDYIHIQNGANRVNEKMDKLFTEKWKQNVIYGFRKKLTQYMGLLPALDLLWAFNEKINGFIFGKHSLFSTMVLSPLVWHIQFLQSSSHAII